MTKNKTTIVTSATLGALCVLGIAGCSASGEESVGDIAEALTTTNLNLYGSDTLASVMIETFALGTNSNCKTLAYLGTGSGNGEKCLRDNSCPNASAHQNFAPMSRPLASGGAVAGEVNNPIGLDGVGAWVKNDGAGTTPSSQSLAQLKAIFCSDNSGCTNAPESGKVYRRDDVSGTTDTIKTLLGCANMCAAGANSNKVCVVAEAPSGVPTIDCGTGTTTSPSCSTAMSATECIGRLIANDATAIAYAGGGARDGVGGVTTTSIKPLSVSNTGSAIAFTEANIRKLITDPANQYPLSRFLYLNYNDDTGRLHDDSSGAGIKQAACFDWLMTPSTGGQKLEQKLVEDGFYVCNTSATLDCTP